MTVRDEVGSRVVPTRLTAGRLLSLDALRGLAMALVVLQHSYLSVAPRLMVGWPNSAIWYTTHLAAIAFVSISGATLSYHLFANPDWATVYRKVVIRAVYFLVAAHFVINLASHYFLINVGAHAARSAPWFEWLVLGMPITDLIGVCLLISPALILGLSTAVRAFSIVAMLIASALLPLYWYPEDHEQRLLAEALIGTKGEPTWFWWPLIPWLAIFISGSFVGSALSEIQKGLISVRELVTKLTKWGFLLLACSITLVLLYEVLKRSHAADSHGNLLFVFYPRRTTSLLPAYFAILAWLFACFLLWINVKRRLTRAQWVLTVVGRTSLFAFVVQYFIVEDLPAFFGFAGLLDIPSALMLFVGGSIAVWSCAYLYGRWSGRILRRDYLECVEFVRRAIRVC